MIYVVMRFSKMHTVTNMYILNLAIADETFLGEYMRICRNGARRQGFSEGGLDPIRLLVYPSTKYRVFIEYCVFSKNY